MKRVIPLSGPDNRSIEVETLRGYDLVAMRFEHVVNDGCSFVIARDEARRLGRALLMAAAGDDFAGGEDLDHGDEMVEGGDIIAGDDDGPGPS